MRHPILHTLWLVACALAGLAAPARATGWMEWLGSPASSSPFTGRIQGVDVSAAYFNPALLSMAPGQLGVALSLLGQSLTIGLSPRPAGADVSEDIFRARLRNEDGTSSRLILHPLPTGRLPTPRQSPASSGTLGTFHFGAIFHPVDPYLTFGFSMVSPMTYFQERSSFYADEREQYFSNALHFERAEDGLCAPQFFLAASTSPFRFLSLGAGVSMATRSRTRSLVYIPDAADQEIADINNEIRITTEWVPHGGLLITPAPGWSLALTAHAPTRSDIDGQAEIQFWNYQYPEGRDSLVQPFAFSQGMLPWRVGVGGAVRFAAGSERGLTLAAQLVWAQWSGYRDRHQARFLDRWGDILTPAAGLKLDLAQGSAALDLVFEPSPVPAQRGRTSYVDNDRLGAALTWERRLSLASHRFALRVQGQLHRLLERSVAKSDEAAHPVLDEFPDSLDLQTGELLAASQGFQSNNPGYPGFRSAGWLWQAGLSLSYLH